MSKRVYRESAQQKIFVRWFKLQYPHFKFLIYKVANGIFVSSAYMRQILSDEGLLAGVPDLHIAIPTKSYPGLFIEMKTIDANGMKTKLSAAQEREQGELRRVGYKVETCWTADEAIQVVKDYFSDL